MMIKCDRARLEIALGNLLENALKFTPQGGYVELGVEKTGARIIFWVEDNGPEIPPEDLPHIFERFYRGSNQQFTGSGLGLAIVHSIVQAHNGSVAAHNLPGGGVRFQIELPV
jgi:signal transduction histidine kinase